MDAATQVASEPTAKAVRLSLNQTVHRAFRWTNLVLAILFLLFAPLDAISLPQPERSYVPLLDLAIAIFLFGLFIMYWIGAVSPRFAHPVGFLTILVGILNGLYLLLATGQPLQSLSFLLVVLAAGLLFLSWAWFTLTLLAANAAMLYAAAAHGWAGLWIQYEVALLTACGLSIVSHAIRLRTYTRLEALRVHDQELNAELAGIAVRARSAEDETRKSVDRLLENERLRTVNNLRTEFINSISHELNTPLTPLILQTQVLKAHAAKHDDPQLRNTAEILERNVQRLKTLVEQMVATARLQSGLVELQIGRVDLLQAVEDAVGRWRDRFNAARVALHADVRAGLFVRADAARLGQVLNEILANAQQFTPESGRVTIGAHAEGKHALVSVRDTGQGIEPSTLARLAQPFAGIGAQTGRVGLGLYLCRLLVELQGGKFSVESAGLGRGTTVHFTIPLETALDAPSTS